jgi:hypothetical protein
MAFILKGASALIDVPAIAVFSELSSDSFICVVKRGNDDEFKQLLEDTRSGAINDRQTLDKYLVRINGLTGADGNLINGDGVLNWIAESRLTQQEPLTDGELETIEVINLMLSSQQYRTALINAVFEGVANRQLYISKRLGN